MQQRKRKHTIIDRFDTDSIQYGKVGDRHSSAEPEIEVRDQFYVWLLGFGKRVKLIYPAEEQEKFRVHFDKNWSVYQTKSCNRINRLRLTIKVHGFANAKEANDFMNYFAPQFISSCKLTKGMKSAIEYEYQLIAPYQLKPLFSA